MVYCRVFPLTVIDFEPDVVVGAFPHPAELPRLFRTSRAEILVELDSGTAA